MDDSARSLSGPSLPAPSLSGLLQQAAADCPDRLAIVEAQGRRLTWAEADDGAARVAAGLEDLGVLAGSRVMFALGNRLEFVTTYWGVLRAQCVAVPVNPRSSVREFARMITDAGARVVVADDSTIEAVRAAVVEVAEDAPRVVVVEAAADDGELAFADLVAADPRPAAPLTDPERLAVLLYTSGSSGLPRAAMLTHRALLANLEQVAAVDPPMMHGDDVVLGLLPLFHVYGLNAVLGSVLRHRAKLVLADGFHPQGTLELIDDEAVSVLPVAPPVFAHWRDVDLAGRLDPVRLVLSGSAPLAADAVENFRERTGIPVHQGYGLTEAAPVVTSTLRSSNPPDGSVGAPLEGIRLRLVDDGGDVVEGEDPGEIQIHGANLFSGYWPDGADGPDAAGWWSTGDVGFLDAESNVFLIDRVRDLIIVSGFNVYPVEVEHVIREVHGVADVAVVGAPDEFTGEAVVAYVVPSGAADTVRDDVAAHCAEALARFKVPTRIEVVEALPLTITGKVQKGRLRGLERRRSLDLIDEPRTTR